MVKFWLIAIVTCGIDLVSKKIIFDWLINTPAQGVVIVPGWLSLNLHINKGAVWGVGNKIPMLLIAISAVIIPIVIYLAYSSYKKYSSFIPVFGFALLLGGALGNLYDRIFINIKLNLYPSSYEGVRDFIDVSIPGVYNWPVFNIADIAIVAGVVIFILASFWGAPRRGVHQ